MEKVTVSPVAIKVFQAINAVQQELIFSGGVGKNSKNKFQGYNYRGIDDVYNVLSPAMVKHGLVILPEVLEQKVKTYTGTVKQGKGPSNITHVFLKVNYKFICVEDGSSHDVIVYGEANDTADKATNKAMSAAFKYMVFQAFCVPTEAEAKTDPDRTGYEIPPQDQGHHQQNQQPQQNRQQQNQNHQQWQQPSQQPEHQQGHGPRDNHQQQPQQNRQSHGGRQGQRQPVQNRQKTAPNDRQHQFNNSPAYIDPGSGSVCNPLPERSGNSRV